jgi:hypothetical protein
MLKTEITPCINPQSDPDNFAVRNDSVHCGNKDSLSHARALKTGKNLSINDAVDSHTTAIDCTAALR